jgi:hypothetical protein
VPAAKLAQAVKAVDWSKNVEAFLAEEADLARLAEANLRLAIWARQFEAMDAGNPALCFLREMQIAGQHVALLTAMGLYKPAAAAMRTVLETALYYTYFRSHHSELTTIANSSAYYIDKREIVEYHKVHTPNFSGKQQKLGLISRLEPWYSAISAVIHGQKPGSWLTYTSIKEVSYSKGGAAAAIDCFVEGEEIVRRLFLCAVSEEIWHGFSSVAKNKLLADLTSDQKQILGLDKN